MLLRSLFRLAAMAVLGLPVPGTAQAPSLNLYSARHYQTDEALYANFTRATGIRINRIEAGDEALLERLRSEGRSSPADVLLLVDAARLWKAQTEGLFAPIRSIVLEERIPEQLRAAATDEGIAWFGVSTRARVILINRTRVPADSVNRYADLANPALKGKVCTRSAAHPYMLSLIAAMIEHQGEEATTQWARGVVANFARPPRGGDTDQIKAVASGECGVALTNTYYLVRMMRSDKPADRDTMSKVQVIWPDQTGTGTHLNVTGGGVLRTAKNRDAAVKFLEYLASDEAQRYLADGNNEWPAVPGVRIDNPALASLGTFKADALPVDRLGRSQAAAARLIDRVGWR
ncbi:MAG: extracellular solute-binding protein [Betaproteobacteria bacterium]